MQLCILLKSLLNSAKLLVSAPSNPFYSATGTRGGGPAFVVNQALYQSTCVEIEQVGLSGSQNH